MRKILIAAIGLATFVFIAFYFFPGWAESKIESEINSIEFLTYDSLDIDIGERSLKIFNLNGRKAGYDGSIDLLEIQGLRLLPILSSRKFVVDEVLAQGVDLTYRLKKRKNKGQQTQDDSDMLDLPNFRIQTINVEEGVFAIHNNLDSIIFKTELRAVLEEFTDSDLQSPGKIPLRLKILEADKSKFFTNDRLYTFDVAVARYQNQSLIIKEITVQSDREKEEIGRLIGHEVDWFNGRVDSIEIDIKDPGTFLKKPQIRKVDIYKPVLDVFRDKRLPSPENHRPPLLRHLLANKKFEFAFDSISVHDGKVVYEEFVKEEKGPGEASFYRINADFTDLKSYSYGLSKRPRLIASCDIYNKAQVFVDASFPINDRSGTTLIKGKMMPVDLTIFNRMIQYVSVVEIKSGYSNLLEFDFSYTDTRSTGEMKFAYNDLAVSFLGKEGAEPDGIFNSAKSFFVNTFVLDSNNDLQSDKFRMGKIDFERVSEKSMFNYWWGSIISGFKSSTGVDTTGEKIDVN